MARPDVEAFLQWQKEIAQQGQNAPLQDAIKAAKAKPVGTNMGQRLLGAGNPGANVPAPSIPRSTINVGNAPGGGMGQRMLGGGQKLLGAGGSPANMGKLMQLLKLLGRGAGGAGMAAAGYGAAEAISPDSAPYMLGPLGAGYKGLENLGLVGNGNTPTPPQGPGLPQPTSFGAPKLDGVEGIVNLPYGAEDQPVKPSVAGAIRNMGGKRRPTLPSVEEGLPEGMGMDMGMPEVPSPMQNTGGQDLNLPSQVFPELMGSQKFQPPPDPKKNALLRAIQGLGRGIKRAF